MTSPVDNGFARIDKESIKRQYWTTWALTWQDIAYDWTSTINEKIDSKVETSTIQETIEDTIWTKVVGSWVVNVNYNDGTWETTISAVGLWTWDMQGANNLSELTDESIARTNLWLWTLATQDGNFSDKANDSAVVHTTWDEPIWGVKTFQWNSSSNYSLKIKNLWTWWSQISFRKPDGNEQYAVTHVQSDQSLRFYNGSTDILNLQWWNVWIWTITPRERLDVVGGIYSNTQSLFWHDGGGWTLSFYKQNNTTPSASNPVIVIGWRQEIGEGIKFEHYDGTSSTPLLDISKTNFSVLGQNWTSAWESYTPTIITNGSATITTVHYADYKQIWKTVFLNARIVINVTSWGSWMKFSINGLSVRRAFAPCNVQMLQSGTMVSPSLYRWNMNWDVWIDVFWTIPTGSTEFIISAVFEVP